MSAKHTLGVMGLFVLLTCPSAEAAQMESVQAFGSNPGNLNMYLYAPNNVPANAPIVVAMHGCTQQANDYVNAGWNELADEYKFYVIYPEQTALNNPAYCFNWAGDYGDTADMTRGKGENQSIVSMVDYVKGRYSVDESKVFVSGFSAGGAFASVLLATWPDVFAAGAINSGVAYWCADNVMPAFRCMLAGKNQSPERWGDLVRQRGFPVGYDGPYPRVSIWQGTSDGTVVSSNAQELVDQWTNVNGVDIKADETDTINTTAGNHDYAAYKDDSGKIVVESYMIAGMDHGVALDPGISSSGGCGSSFASYFYDEKICSTYRQMVFFGLDNQDNTAPDIAITSPSDGATVSGSVTISVTATDEEGVDYVEFWVDGQSIGSDQNAPYTHSWDASQSTNGTHNLVAVAYDEANNSSQDNVSVIVEGGLVDSEAPSVSLLSPSDGDTIGVSTTLLATATDNFGVTEVAFYVDTSYLGSVMTPPYQFEWETSAVEEGVHTLSVEAFDAAGLSSVDDSTTITVDRTISDFVETFSSTGPDNDGWILGGWSLDNQDHTPGNSASISAEAKPSFGSANEVARVEVELGLNPVLSYYRQLDFYVANSFAEAAFRVNVDGTTVDEKVRSNAGGYDENTWTSRSNIDLSNFAGQTVTITFEVSASDSASIITSAEAWVDDIEITNN